MFRAGSGGAGLAAPASGRRLPSPPPCPPTVSLLSAHPCPRVAAPLSSSGPSSSPADAWALSLSSAPSHPALLCLPSPSSSSSSLGSGKNTAHFSFSWVSVEHEGRPALCQDFPLARSPPPQTASTQVVMSDWKPRARPGEDSGSGSFLGGREGPPPRVQLVPRHSSQSALWSLSLPRGGGLS